jgi:general secretion pathway protein C
VVTSSKVKNQRPPLERWYSYILVVFVGFCIADLVILGFRDKMLPQSAPPAHPKSQRLESGNSRGAYNTIITRNVFSSDGLIPDALATKGQDPATQKELPPVLSSLPLNLIGTLVHSDPEKSIAAIELKGKNQTLPYIPKKDIEGMATIVSVERNRVIFRNLNSNRLEYIEMKHENKVAFGGGLKTGAVASKDVQKIGDNNFAIKRADLLKYTSDLSTVLMQARAVPNRAPGTGEINGYRLLDIQTGSIFEQLGLQRMDVIKGVDGSPVDSPGKAMELYNALKNSPKLSIQIERNGKTENMSYTIQ